MSGNLLDLACLAHQRRHRAAIVSRSLDRSKRHELPRDVEGVEVRTAPCRRARAVDELDGLPLHAQELEPRACSPSPIGTTFVIWRLWSIAGGDPAGSVARCGQCRGRSLDCDGGNRPRVRPRWTAGAGACGAAHRVGDSRGRCARAGRAGGSGGARRPSHQVVDRTPRRDGADAGPTLPALRAPPSSVPVSLQRGSDRESCTEPRHDYPTTMIGAQDRSARRDISSERRP